MKPLTKHFFLCIICVAAAFLNAQTASSGVSIPEALVRPSRSEAPRYPRDAVIGELGAGDLQDAHFAFANSVLRALLLGREQAAVFAPLPEGAAHDVIARIAETRANKFRIGGGKEQADGAFSFLFRFIGSGGTVGGELYFVMGQGGFTLDDIVLEEIPPALLDDDKDRAYNISPYERFY